MKSLRLSVVLATHNEAGNLPRCLDSVGDLADEIIIVDGQSSDDTVKIARKYSARIISTSNKPNFHINKKIGIDAARGEWVLQLDADEALSKDLYREIEQIISHPSETYGYWMPRLNNFLGRFLTKGGQYPDYTLRLYKNGKGNLPAKDVHEQAVVEGPVGYLKHDLLHYGTPDFENYLTRYNRYTSLLADQLKDEHLPINILSAVKYLIIKPKIEFLSIFIRHRGYVDGFAGFIFALFSGLRFAVAYIKYWQIVKYPA
jgi:glycosyltransferase involved in cell wall biosynthesis